MDPLLLAYLAGVFDGEGSIGHYRSGDAYPLTLELKMTDQAIPKLFAQTFGGPIQLRTFAKATAIANWRKDQWRWRVRGTKAVAAYAALEPYLRLKRFPAPPHPNGEMR